MSELLPEVYDVLIKKYPLSSQHYLRAMEQWSRAQTSSLEMDLEDAAHAREYEFGYLTFQLGIQLGLNLVPGSE